MDGPLSRDKLRDDLNAFAKDTLRPLLDELVRNAMREELSTFAAEKLKDVKTPLKGNRLMKRDSTATASMAVGSVGASRLSIQKFTPVIRVSQEPTILETDHTPPQSPRIGYTALSATDNDEESVASRSLSKSSSQMRLKPRDTFVSSIAENVRQDRRLTISRKEGIGPSWWGQLILEHVSSSRFGLLTGIMVILNALCIGFDTDYRIQHRGLSFSIAPLTEIFFCVFFACEISMRLFAYRLEFFTGESKAWNIFDLILVGLQVFDQVVTLFKAIPNGMSSNLTTLRLLRILRVLRVVRLVRVLHLFTELRQIVASMMNSFSVLMWSLSILLMVMYLFSIILLQFALDAKPDMEHSHKFQKYFGSLSRAMFTLFESIVGGLNWDDVVKPLDEEISVVAGLVFSLYVAASMFAIMNMLTGVFVDRAMQCVREDKDYCLANQIRDLFLQGNEHINTDEWEIDYSAFKDKLDCKVMRDYLEQLNVNVSESEALWDLLDVDGSGSVSSTEIIDGCLRLRGPAKALDLALLMRETGLLSSEVRNLTTSFFAMAKGPTSK